MSNTLWMLSRTRLRVSVIEVGAARLSQRLSNTLGSDGQAARVVPDSDIVRLMPRRKLHLPHMEAPKQVTIHPTARLAGSIRVPGDKSISHRYAMLSALTERQVVDLWNYAPGADCHSTLKCLNQLSVPVQVVPKWVAYSHGEVDLSAQETEALAYVRIRGRGAEGLREPQTALDCGNSGIDHADDDRRCWPRTRSSRR